MKLAEALVIRGDLQDRIHVLRERLENNAVVQAGEQPAEDPRALLRELDGVLDQLETLVLRINLTNAAVVSEGRTMTAMLAQRDRLRQEITLYRDFLSSASSTGRRARGSEIRLESTVPVAELQKDVDKRAMTLRKLELKIQELNWHAELQTL